MERKEFTSGLKPTVFERLTAWLKPCPYETCTTTEWLGKVAGSAYGPAKNRALSRPGFTGRIFSATRLANILELEGDER